tara:strand:- start:53 stop:253 length:201 start_codon:yes stop_codon:yes gene_type:complete
MFKHLKDVNMTYFEHMKFSLFLSFTFFKAALGAFVHSIYPDILVTSSTETLELLNIEMEKKNVIHK